jgi:broad specificity phosphatase PhoE
MKLLLIRHGESVGNVETRMAGQTADPLTAKGHQQVAALAQWLWHRGEPPTALYSSPLRRAVETTEGLLLPWGWQSEPLRRAIADDGSVSLSLVLRNPQGTSLPVTLAPALMEFQAGIFTGLTWAEAKAQHPTLCHALETSPDWIPIPQAETPQQGRDRAQGLIQYLLQTYPPEAVVWIVSHHWILEHLIAALMGCDRTWRLTIPNTALFEFTLDLSRWHQPPMARWTSDLWRIHHFGDRPHLEVL